MEEISFENYLRLEGHTNATIRSYLFANKIFIADTTEPERFTYKDVVNYLYKKSGPTISKSRKVHLLYAMKKYFDYLVKTGRRTDHPCRGLHLRIPRKRGMLHCDLFSSTELELLLKRVERYKDLADKNKILITLLIYQGLTSAEIAALNTGHIDLDQGTVHVGAGRRSSQRDLKLHKRQCHLFQQYLSGTRKRLLQADTNAFVLGKSGNRITPDGIHYLVSCAKGLFPGRNLTPAGIRQSVIANWLNEKKIPLEQVQILAGQKWTSTTERYRQANLEEQRVLINKWFPL